MNREEVRRNQALVAEVNKRIAEITVEQREAKSDFLCECGRSDCGELITLDLDEFRAVRRDDRRFAIVPGHLVAEVDSVEESRSRYDVVRLNEDAS